MSNTPQVVADLIAGLTPPSVAELVRALDDEQLAELIQGRPSVCRHIAVLLLDKADRAPRSQAAQRDPVEASPETSRSQPSAPVPSPRVSVAVEEAAPLPVDEHAPTERSEPREAVIAALRFAAGAGLSRRQLAVRTGYAQNTVTRHLRALLEEGLVRNSGRTQNARWFARGASVREVDSVEVPEDSAPPSRGGARANGVSSNGAIADEARSEPGAGNPGGSGAGPVAPNGGAEVDRGVVRLVIVPVEKLTEGYQLFECAPLHARLSAKTCVAKQERAAETSTGENWRDQQGRLRPRKANGSTGLRREVADAARRVVEPCADCELGRRVAERLGAS